MANSQEIREGVFTQATTEVPRLYTFFNEDLGAVKAVTVPNNEVWKLNYLLIRFECSASVGDRRVLIEIEDRDGNIIERIRVRATQAATELRDYRFINNIVSEQAFHSDKIYTAIPGDVYLDSGYTLKLSDENLIDAVGDRMTVSFQVSQAIV